MARSIETKIRFEAAIIYVIVAIGVVAMILYLSNLRRNMLSRRAEITTQQVLLSATNKLIFAVGEAQSASSLYLSTKRRAHLAEYTRSVDSIQRLIDTMVVLNPQNGEKLIRIGELLRRQALRISNLSLQFARTNPVAVISERLHEYEPQSRLDTLIVNVRQDTVIDKAPRRKFLRRLADVFSPRKDSVKVIVNQRVDTIRTSARDSLGILAEVGDIAQKAQRVYTQNLQTIERHVGELILSDQQIAREASALLLELHRETLETTISVIDANERMIARNYFRSIAGGTLALVLILVFIVLIITDINKGRAARLALAEANRRTRQIMESRHQLLLSVSHDIKSPLNSILGYLSLMQGDDRVRSMRNSSEHILSMLENLLEFSSLEQGTLQVNRSDFSLNDLCREICDMFGPLADRKSLALECRADRVRIHTDRVKLKQVIINLVSNAVKYTERGSIHLTACYEGGTLRLEVRDTGAGIPAGKLPQLFLPFSRIEQNNSLADGSGLGLFVVKGLVDLLDGEIAVDSEVGRGTRITIQLAAPLAAKEIPRGTKRVKVWDDDPAMLRVAEDMLLRLGHKVVDEAPDLILTDMEMGDITGLDILRGADGIPVVVMTGRADFSAEKAREMGFDGFLAKPFSQESLRGIVGDGDPAEDLLGDDREAVLAIFRTSTAENFEKLRRALADDDFPTAQAVCHKMYPMFAQLGYPTEELRRMDTHRDGEYEGWRADVEKVLAVRV